MMWTGNILMLSVLSIPAFANNTLPPGQVLFDVLEQIVKPYLDIKFRSVTPIFKLKHTPLGDSMDEVIRKRVKELKPYLQDSDFIENITSTEDKTHIMDIDKKGLRSKTPVNVDKKLKHYKGIRNRIKSELENEPISKNTTKLILSTLNQMLTDLLENQCDHKNRTKTRTRSIPDNIAESPILQSWLTSWKKLKKKYLGLLRDKANEKETLTNDVVKFFDEFNTFFAQVMKDTKSISEKYNIRCFLIDKGKVNEERRKNIIDDLKQNTTHCDDFKVCSKELEKFMSGFYLLLNSTSVSVLRNYAAMYLNDRGSNEQFNIISTIKSVGEYAEIKINKIFKAELSKFELDKDKNKDENFKLIKYFIQKNIDITKEKIRDRVKNNFADLDEKLSTALFKDISVNLEIELGNLEQDVKERLCKIFNKCNGKYSTNHRRSRRIGSDVYYRMEPETAESQAQRYKPPYSKPIYILTRTSPITDAEVIKNNVTTSTDISPTVETKITAKDILIEAAARKNVAIENESDNTIKLDKGTTTTSLNITDITDRTNLETTLTPETTKLVIRIIKTTAKNLEERKNGTKNKAIIVRIKDIRTGYPRRRGNGGRVSMQKIMQKDHQGIWDTKNISEAYRYGENANIIISL